MNYSRSARQRGTGFVTLNVTSRNPQRRSTRAWEFLEDSQAPFIAMRRKRKSKRVAPALIKITTAADARGRVAPCVYALCLYAGATAGPFWGDGRLAVNRATAALSRTCPCQRRKHKVKAVE